MRLKLNPAIPLFRILAIAIYIGILYFYANLWYDDLENIIDNPAAILLMAFYLFIFYAVIVSMIKGLMTEIQFVKLETKILKIANPIKFKEQEIAVRDINCIYKSQKRFGRGYTESLVIRTKNNQIFELPKHHYFNFNNFIEQLKVKKLPYKTSIEAIVECELKSKKIKATNN
jgi:hypothetical protein